MLDRWALKNYVSALTDETVYFIGIHCALPTMEEREVLRGDRSIGLSHGQINRVHKAPRHYDFTIDTTNASSFECAKQIMEFIKLNPQPKGFKELAALFS